MSVTTAALSLRDELKDTDWFVAVGIGFIGDNECIYLYVKDNEDHSVWEGLWDDFPVVVKPIAEPQPLTEQDDEDV